MYISLKCKTEQITSIYLQLFISFYSSEYSIQILQPIVNHVK